MRSSSGPLRRRWWRARSAAEQRQRWSPSPHGHGFDAATSMQRVGNSITRCERTIATRPSSSGWRSASSAERANSDSSSRNSTPWCASVTSPGAGHRAAADQPRRRDRVVRRAERPRLDEPAARVQAGDRVDARDLDRLAARRAAAGSTAPAARASSCRCPAGRGGTGCGRPPRRRRSRAAARRGRGRRPCPAARAAAGSSRLRDGLGQRRHLGAPGEDVGHLVQRVDRDDLDALDQRRLARPRGRDDDPRAARARAVPCATASAPRIGRSSPVSDSSPANTQPSTCSRSTWPLAARIAIASGRSKPGPILRR